MRIKTYPYTLELRHTFTLSHSSRKKTDIVIVEFEHNGIKGYGEASLPPYYPETQSSVMDFINKIPLKQVYDIIDPEFIIETVHKLTDRDYAAKAAFDCAMWDWYGKQIGLPLYAIWNLDIASIPPTSFTIAIDEPDIVRRRAADAHAFSRLKIKLGSKNDREIVTAIRDVSEQPLYVDVNQGWSDKYFALDMIEWLKEKNVVLVEQPLPAGLFDESVWLCERSPLPVVADESVKGINDIDRIQGAFHGINIKLMKCGGLSAARTIINYAKQKQLKIMIGCMTESSCAISAASHLSALADWVDLDGSLLIANDPFTGSVFSDGKIIPRQIPGTGASLKFDFSD
jgi:L-alanine-DL-glutamate epimerase-like enolase superfamily enzyme